MRTGQELTPHSHEHSARSSSHHHPRRKRNKNRLALTLVLVVGYMVAEVVGGWLANSLALLADAGHMFSDAAALALSLFALWIAQRPPTPQHTYGYYRAEILAALANGAILGVISVFVFVEAFQRLTEPPEVQGSLMLGIALGGLAVNLAGLWILNTGKAESLNIRGAWLHILMDALGSVAVIVAAGLIWAFGWHWADPAFSLLIGLLVIYSSWTLLKEAVAVLMEGTPGHIDIDQVRAVMAAVPGVREVHDLHIWTITSGMESLSGHAVIDEAISPQALLHTLRKLLYERFGIDHITIQIELPDFEEHPTAF